jgi:hypothetical protein
MTISCERDEGRDAYQANCTTGFLCDGCLARHGAAIAGMSEGANDGRYNGRGNYRGEFPTVRGIFDLARGGMMSQATVPKATNSEPRRERVECSWCNGTGSVDIDGRAAQCGMCKGWGGWYVSEPFPADDPNREIAGAWLLCALGALCVAVAIAAGVA